MAKTSTNRSKANTHKSTVNARLRSKLASATPKTRGKPLVTPPSKLRTR